VQGLAAVGVASATLLSPVGPAAAAGPEYVDVVGHGYGHGRGMGQYGARGYADAFGWSHTQILNHFYGGTTAGWVSPGQPLRVWLCDQEGVVICSTGGGLGSILVTSGAPFRVEGVDLSPGTAVRIVRSDKFYLEQSPGGCAATGPWTPVGGGSSLDSGMDIDSLVQDPGTDKSKMLELCGPKRRTYRGVLDYTMDGTKARLVNTLGIDGYLRGVVPAEMPASWASAALRAQAVAARSYALADRRFTIADTCDTVQCQVYQGANVEQVSSSAAIDATAGEVRLRNGSIIGTEFSSSTGGWTAGGTFPPVEDRGDGATSNPNHTWSVRLTDDQIEAAYGLTDLLDIQVEDRNGLGEYGGRVTMLRIVGSNKTVFPSGDDFRIKLGLRSNWFTPTPAKPPVELVWTIRSTATPGAPTGVVRYGGPTDRAISCDWDGDGDDTLGVYSGGTWYLRDDLSPGAPTRVISYGAPDYIPVCGDWDGNGTETIGVYTARGWWLLRNDLAAGPPQIAFQYGYSAATPVVGDWDGSDPAAEIGVFDAGQWSLRHDVGPGGPQRAFSYGYGGTLPVVGDWDGSGSDGIGVYDQGTWMLRETATPGQPERWFNYGYPGPSPITGRWATSAEGVGIVAVG